MFNAIKLLTGTATALLLSATLHAQVVIADFTMGSGPTGYGDGVLWTNTSVADADSVHILGSSLNGGSLLFGLDAPVSIGSLDALSISASLIEGNGSSTLGIMLFSGDDWAGTATAVFDLTKFAELSFSNQVALLTFDSGFDSSNIQAFSVFSTDYNESLMLNLSLGLVTATSAPVEVTPTPVPEPATNAVMLGSALLGLGAWRKRRKNRA